ncbi:DUF3052 domain-containing protein [Streptomyces sp. NPDC002588]|uniref:DUF3052 domain-containing protein n=1 Tax=Streptomyces sp. NPDC002588 TaxID=3154419 RepID=UPI00332712C3
MSTTADSTNTATMLGFERGMVVQEIGYAEDSDDQFRRLIEGTIGSDLVYEDHEDIVNMVVVWFREDDGDLSDTLVDASGSLGEGGTIVLLTPKSGRPGHVDYSDIGGSAVTAGFSATEPVSATRAWSATTLLSPTAARSGRH